MSPPETSEQTEVPDLELEVGERASWEGSDVTPDEIQWLRATRRIPAGVECRLPEGELEPQVKQGERVVFVAHQDEVAFKAALDQAVLVREVSHVAGIGVNGGAKLDIGVYVRQ